MDNATCGIVTDAAKASGRECVCGEQMEYVGSMGGDGRFWCPRCGRYSQSYVCTPTMWRVPRIALRSPAKHELEALATVLDDYAEAFDESYFAHESKERRKRLAAARRLVKDLIKRHVSG